MSTFFRRVALGVLGVLACVGPASAWQPEPEPPGAAAEDVRIPNTHAGNQMRWVLEVLSGTKELGDPVERFTPRFLEIVPAKKLDAAIKDIRENAFKNTPVRVISLEGEGTDESLAGNIRGGDPAVGMTVLSFFIAVDAATDKISGLRFDRPKPDVGQIGDWEAFDASMGKTPGLLSFAAYEIVQAKRKEETDGKPAPPENRNDAPEIPATRLVPVHTIKEDLSLAIGSAFKLYVLGAAVEEVLGGRLSWDEKLAIDEAKKSLPSGVMQTLPAGTELAISRFAERMISISDNTATDHLLSRVGREKVGAYYAARCGDSRRTLPFLSTMEMFKLKLVADDAQRAAYIEGDAAARGVMLGGEIAAMSVGLEHARGWEKPVAIDAIEWFATGEELCRVWMDLRRAEQTPGMEALSFAVRKNPGLSFDKQVWPKVAFKGGAEVGVLCLSFLLERDDGRWFTLAAVWNDPEKPLQEDRLMRLMEKGIELVEKHGRKLPPDGDVERNAEQK